LYFLDDDRHDFLDANGAALSLTYLRLTVLFKIGPHAHGRDGLLDTGTALTIFPDALWRSFEQVIEWLHPIPGRPIPFWWTSSTGITGHGFPCRIGRVSVNIVDLQNNVIRAIPVIGKFVNDNGRLRERVLFGLSHGILQSCKLHLDIDKREAWLQERG
jgi:hypothetical protein